MKKMIMSLALAGVALGLGGCNSKSEPADGGYGAYYPFNNYLIRTDGTKFTLPAFSNDLTLNRYFASFYGTIPEGTPEGRGPGVTVPITAIYDSSGTFATYAPTGNTAYNDPLTGMVKFNSGTSTVETVVNFLIFYPQFFYFTEEAAQAGEVARVNFDLEADSEVIPGVQNDTINMRLKFFNNRASGETISTSNYFANPYAQPCAIDLDYLNFDRTDATGKNKTYIIKLNYQSYEWEEGFTLDETKVYTKFLTCKWTPGDPYGQDASE